MLATLLSVFCFSYIIRIFERPYFYQMDSLEFSGIGSSVWFVIISMTTVGYGGIFPSTVPGRALTIIAVLVGAVILSVLISVIDKSLNLQDNEKEALKVTIEKKRACRVIKTALQYNLICHKRSQNNIEKEAGDEKPTQKEVLAMKKEMTFAVERYKRDRESTSDIDEHKERDVEVAIIK